MTSLATHAVPGQVAGYLYQLDLALLRLAESTSGGRVGVETLDDVTAVYGDGTTTLTQAKSSIDPDANPFADGAIGLWKALHTWGDAIKAGEISRATTTLYLISNTQIPACLATALGAAQSDDAICSCIERLRKTPASPSEKAKPHVAAVRGFSDTILKDLVFMVRCLGKQHGTDLSAIRQQTAAKLHLPPDVEADEIIDELLGWLHQWLMTLWLAKTPAWIRQDEFDRRLNRTLIRQQRRARRELPALKIFVDPADTARHKTSIFARQLELIALTPDELESAICDFLRHNHERLRLSKEGELDEGAWEEFDDRLVEYWRPIFNAELRQVAHRGPVPAGQKVFEETQKHRESLDGLPTEEPYLTRGAYHRLADDGKTVGWHPEFRTRCGAATKGDGNGRTV